MPRVPTDGERGALPWVLPLLAILACSTVLDAFFFTGYHGLDSLEYLSGAHHILRTGVLPEVVALGHERMALVGWNVLIGWLVGWNAQLVAASYIVFHQALTLCTFLFARHWFNWKAGLLAAWCLAVYPELIIHSTIIIPDIPLALFILLAVRLFLWGYELRQADRNGRALLCFVLAGFTVGVAYMTKSTALLVLPFFLVLWLFSERFRPRGWGFGAGGVFVAGIVAVFVLEWGLLRALTGAPYFRLSWLFAARAPGEELIARYGTDPWERLLWFLRRFDGARVPHDLSLLFLGGIVLYPVLLRRRWTVLMLPLWWFVYLTWGTMSFSRYFPGPIHFRYYIPALPFVAMLFAAVAVRIAELVGRVLKPRSIRRGLLTVAVLVAAICPLRHLSTPNYAAGKFYRAAAIAGAVQAVRFSETAQLKPLVMSDVLYEELSALYLDSRPEGFIPGRDLSEEQLDQLLNNGFYYVGSPQPIYSESMESYRRTLVDDVLHPAVRENPFRTTRTEGRFAVQTYATPDGDQKVIVGNRQLVVEELARFGRLKDRLSEVASLIAPQARRYPIDESCRQVGVYRVETRPAGSGPPQTDQLTPGLWNWQIRDGKDEPYNWGIRKGTRYELSRTADDSVHIRTDLEPGEYLWFMARERALRSHLHVQKPGMYTLTVEMERQGNAQVQVLLRTYADLTMSGEPVGEWRVHEKRGETRFGFYHAGGDLFLRLQFKLDGKGEVTFKRVTLTRRTATTARASSTSRGPSPTATLDSVRSEE